MTPDEAGATVAIVGGGYSGAAVAFHLARAAPRGLADIIVFEPRERLGAGLAYSTDDPSHRVNVPADKLTFQSKNPSDFADWLRRTGAADDDGEAEAGNGDFYPQRAVFGAYTAACIAPLLSTGQVRHRPVAMAKAMRANGKFLLLPKAGQPIQADIVVLATTHPAPRVPAPLRALEGTEKFITDPYAADALEAIARHDRILIVGTGLTSADVIASLHRRGHDGPIVALSRHGLRSQAHASNGTSPEQPQTANDLAPHRASALLRTIRLAVAAAAKRGETWHAVLDGVRKQGTEIWQALPEDGRARIVRHLRTYWDIHRFRVAPQLDSVILRALGEDRLRYRAATLTNAERSPSGLRVHFRPRGSEQAVAQEFDAVVVTTGPAHSDITRTNGFLRELRDVGLIVADKFGLGIAVDQKSRALSRSGLAQEDLLIAGPLARGTFGELMGVPEVTLHAEQVAQHIALLIRSSAFNREKVS